MSGWRKVLRGVGGKIDFKYCYQQSKTKKKIQKLKKVFKNFKKISLGMAWAVKFLLHVLHKAV
jgi:hypothetical protein